MRYVEFGLKNIITRTYHVIVLNFEAKSEAAAQSIAAFENYYSSELLYNFLGDAESQADSLLIHLEGIFYDAKIPKQLLLILALDTDACVLNGNYYLVLVLFLLVNGLEILLVSDAIILAVGVVP